MTFWFSFILHHLVFLLLFTLLDFPHSPILSCYCYCLFYLFCLSLYLLSLPPFPLSYWLVFIDFWLRSIFLQLSQREPIHQNSLRRPSSWTNTSKIINCLDPSFNQSIITLTLPSFIMACIYASIGFVIMTRIKIGFFLINHSLIKIRCKKRNNLL